MDQELARQLVELGHKGSSLEREEFETSKAAAEASRLASESQQKKLASIGKELKDNFLRALAEREEANRSGEMTVSTLLQHSICYVMGFPQNSSAIPLGREHNPHCVTFRKVTPLLLHTLLYCHLSLLSQRRQTVNTSGASSVS
ncbi:uncharacterized protein LOC109097055 isoform X1 [Cyprinus carpio]|uniref:Cilia- and flagella-associated protein 299 n=1 Tax=Cyprinus carpio TaxID=7962 RepID=A0A9Q9Y2M5_CYPCA|nr:uncharacterized protein LOC109097055 isoform X1 [Cyprinus carpio]